MVTLPAELKFTDVALKMPPPRAMEVPLTVRAPTFTLVAPASEIAPVDVRIVVPPVLIPTISIEESSAIVTGPAVLKVRVPALKMPPPNDMEVHPNEPSPATVTLVAPASESVPVALIWALPAVLTPTMSRFESSMITTEPAELNVRVPTLKIPPPKAMEVPLNDPNPITFTLVAPASDSAPAAVRSALLAVLTPTIFICDPSLIVTAPMELKVNVPALNALAVPILIDKPVRSARPPIPTIPELVIAPPARIVAFPLAVSAGRSTAALLKVTNRFRRPVRPESVGTVAPAFTLRSPKSRTLPCVPTTPTPPPKLFASVWRRMSVPGVVTSRVVAPVTVRAPV